MISPDNSSSSKQTSFDCSIKVLFDYYNITNLPDSVEPTWTFLVILNVIASPVTTVLNFLIIWTILSDKELRKVTHNVLLAALALTDFFEGLVVEPLFSWFLVALIKRHPVPCQLVVYALPALILSCWTLTTLTLASVDLYLAIEHPQFYLEHVTIKKVAIGTGIFWIVNPSVLVCGSIKLGSHEVLKRVPNAIFAVINILVSIYCTARVQITARRQRRNIQAQVEAVQGEPNTDQNNNRRPEYFKQALTVAMIVLATFVFYCPFIIHAIIQTTKGNNITDDFIFIGFAIEVTFVHLQSLVNPIVVFLRLSYILEGVKKKLLCRSDIN